MKFLEYPVTTEDATYFESLYPKEDLLYFDIETTGFAPYNTILYFIGCMYYKDASWYVGQWFNDDGTSEAAILTAFMEFTKSYKVFIHFNGDGFDIPYLQKKYEQYHISYDFSHLESIDIYKCTKSYKNILQMPNFKLKSIESILGIQRIDTYSGGELIAIYDQYLKNHDEELFTLLFNHNFEDIKNMLYISEMMRYKAFFEGDFKVLHTDHEKDHIKLFIQATLPNTKQKFAVSREHIYVLQNPDGVTIQVPIFNGELKFYFEDYSNYYYLPIEDTAIHKTVANYMDKKYRKKATKETCYQRLSGSFLPTCNYVTDKAFGSCYKNRHAYMDATYINNPSFDMHAYAASILQWLHHSL